MGFYIGVSIGLEVTLYRKLYTSNLNRREKGRRLTHSYDKNSYTIRKWKSRETTKTRHIKLRLPNDFRQT